MGLALPVVWSDLHRLHEPGGEIWVGVRTPGTERPARAEAIRVELSAAGAPFVDAQRQPADALHAVHDPALSGYLACAWEDWEAAGLPDDPGQDRVVPYLFPDPSLFSGFAPASATAPSARAGQFAYDTMTLVGPGTWRAARAAIDTAVTAAAVRNSDEAATRPEVARGSIRRGLRPAKGPQGARSRPRGYPFARPDVRLVGDGSAVTCLNCAAESSTSLRFTIE